MSDAEFLALARKGSLSQLREVLSTLNETERRSRLQAEDEHGNTAALLAIIYEYPNVASLLLQFEETDALHMNERGYSALSLAARSKRPYVVSAVLHRLLSVEHLERGQLVTMPMLAQVVLTSSGPGSANTVSLKLARENLIDLYTQLEPEAL